MITDVFTAILAATVNFTALTAAQTAVARVLRIDTASGNLEVGFTYRVAAVGDGNELVAEFTGAEVWFGNVEREGAIPLDPEEFAALGVDPRSNDLGRLIAWEWADESIRRAAAARG